MAGLCPESFPFLGGGAGGGGNANPVVNLLQHDDLRKGASIFLKAEEGGPDWKFEGYDRDHIEILRKLSLDGDGGGGLDIAVPADLAVPGGLDTWNLELTRGDTAELGIPAMRGAAATEPVQAYGDFYIPGSTTQGIRVTLEPHIAEGAAGNAYRLDFQYSDTVNTLIYASLTQEYRIFWSETSTVQEIVDDVNALTSAIELSLISGTSPTAVMGHGRTEAEVFGGQTVLQDGTNNYILFHDGVDLVPAVPGVAGVQSYVDVYQPGSTTLGFRVTLFNNAIPGMDTTGVAGDAYKLSVVQAAFVVIVTRLIGQGTFQLDYTATATIQDIIDTIHNTGFVSAAALPGTDTSTVMGQFQTGAELFGSQTFDDTGTNPVADFHSGVDAVQEVERFPFLPGVQSYRDVFAPMPAAQAFGDFYIPGSTTLGLRVTIGTISGIDSDGANGNLVRLDFAYASGTVITRVSVGLSPDVVNVRWNETETLQEIIDGAAGQSLVNISLIPGTDGSTVMGTAQTAAQVFGGQTILQDGVNNYILFHDGADAGGVTDDGFRISIAEGEAAGTAGDAYTLDVDYINSGTAITATQTTILLSWSAIATLNAIIATINASNLATAVLTDGADGTTVIGHPGNADQFNGSFASGVDAIQESDPIPAVPPAQAYVEVTVPGTTSGLRLTLSADQAVGLASNAYTFAVTYVGSGFNSGITVNSSLLVRLSINGTDTLNEIINAVNVFGGGGIATATLLPGSDGTTVFTQTGPMSQFDMNFANGAAAIQDKPRDPLVASIDAPNRYIRLEALITDSREAIDEVLADATYGVGEVLGRNHVAIRGTPEDPLAASVFPDVEGNTIDYPFDTGTDHEPITWFVDDEAKLVRLDYDSTDTYGEIQASAEAQVRRPDRRGSHRGDPGHRNRPPAAARLGRLRPGPPLRRDRVHRHRGRHPADCQLPARHPLRRRG